jgi:predicted site-specific integrase-resolvase
MSQTTPATLPASETTDDLCRVLRVTPQTIRRMETEGRIPPAAVKIGRRKLWPAGTAAALLAASQTGGQQ